MPHLQIYQIKEGYCYNSDSLFLWNFIMPHIRRGMRALELGSGSGIIGLLCARECDIALYQIEKQEIYALFNAKNAQVNKLDSIVIHADCKDVAKSKDIKDFLYKNMLCNKEKIENLCCDALRCGKQFKEKNPIISLPYFDIVFSNPPFYPQGNLPSQNPIKEQARQSENLPFSSMLLLLKRLLKPNGRFLFCYAPSMLAEILAKLTESHFGVESLRFVYPRIEKKATLVLVHARANSPHLQTHILPPLITHNGTAQLDNTKEVQEIYAKASTQSIKVRLEDIVEGGFYKNLF